MILLWKTKEPHMIIWNLVKSGRDQRSRVDWLKNGDKNTIFFHRRASQWSKNTIRRLKDKDGLGKDSFDDLQNIMIDFYSSLFKGGDIVNVDTCCQLIQRRLSPQMATLFSVPYTSQEVCDALLSTNPIKTPGLDGFCSLFYKKYWDFVGDGVTQIILQILNENRDPTEFKYYFGS